MRLSALLPALALALALAPLTISPPTAHAVGPGGWDHLGTGSGGAKSLNNDVLAMSTDVPGRLIVGGKFTKAGGVTGADRIASWNGTAWSTVGPPGSLIGGEVRALAVSGSRIFVGGTFNDAGTVTAADKVAAWDGVSWSAPCNGTPLVNNVNALRVVGNELFVGGEFLDGFGNPNADYLVSCNLTSGAVTVTTTTAPFPGPVNALTSDGSGRLYAGGNFQNLEGNTASDFVAAFSAGTWSNLGAGALNAGLLTGIVRSLASNGTDVFIGSDATDLAGIAQADHVARWNGTAWSALGAGPGGTNGYFPAVAPVYALLATGSTVYASGDWQNAGGDATSDYFAAFNGSTWSPLGSNGAGDGALQAKGEAIAIFANTVHAGGNFTAAGGDALASYVARYAPVFVPPDIRNAIKLKKLVRVPRKGLGLMSVVVPGAGAMALSGKGVKGVRKAVAAAGTVVLKVRAKGRSLKQLKAQGKVTVKVTVTFTPTGGTPGSATRKVRLVLRPG